MASPSGGKPYRRKRKTTKPPARKTGKAKEPQEARKADESRFEHLLLAQSGNDIPYSVTSEGIATYIGPQVSRYGLSAKSLISRSLLEVVIPEDRERVAREFRETMTTGREFPTEFRIEDKNGRVYWLEDYGHVRRDESGKIVGLAGVLRDITERKRVEQALREKDLFLRTVLSNAPVTLFVEDPEGVFQFIAGAGLQAAGFSSEEMIGRSVFDLFPDVKQAHENLKRALRGESFTSTLTYRGRASETSYSPLRDANGEIVGVIGVVTDITEQRAAENALEQKNIALHEVLAGIQEQKDELGQTIANNVDNIIMPLIHVLERALSQGQQRYMELLKRNLLEITSPFASGLSARAGTLTPTETHICDLIRRGLSSKEIGELQHISPATVNKHRARIRRKLRITNKKVNLTAYLQTLTSS